MSTIGLYYLTRHNELGKLMRFHISLDMVFGLVWRCAITGLAADIASRRLFVNYYRLRQHTMAENEIKKVMRMWPNARPHITIAEKPNSYFWV